MHSMQFADIHTHFIPGIDDGSISMEQTVEMLRLAHSHGTRSLVATPHMFLDMYPGNDIQKVKACFAATINEIAKLSEQPENVFLKELKLTLGSENYASLEFLEALHRNSVLPINGGKYLLVEISPFLPLGKLEVITHNVLQSGYIPVIAHVERIMGVQERPRRMERFTEAGCILQVNADSVLDTASSRHRKTAFSLASRNLLHIISSDGHRPDRRPPVLLDAYHALEAKYSEEQVDCWMTQNPGAVISSLPISRHS